MTQMTWQDVFDGLEHRRLMYLPTGTFGEVWAYLLGFDAGRDDDLVDRYRERLVERHPDHSNHTAASLTLIDVLGRGADPTALSEEEHRAVIRACLLMMQECLAGPNAST